MNISLAAEPIAHIGSMPITNSMVNAWIAVIFFILVALVASRRKGIIPKGIHNVFEAVVEFLITEIQKVTIDRERALKFLPLAGTIFLFVLFSNWLGQIPGTGSIGIHEVIHGEVELIPLLRPASSDLNMTLAIAIFAVVASHLFGLVKIGPLGHISKFINFRGIWQSIKKGPMAMIVAVIEFGVGLIEIVSEIAKVLSLSLRLFGNIFAGEVLMTIVAFLVPVLASFPFLILEIFVGLVQALVFSLLTSVFMSLAVAKHH